MLPTVHFSFSVYVYFFLRTEMVQKKKKKCLLCSSLKQQNTAVVRLACVHMIFNVVALISSIYLFLNESKLNSEYLTCMMLHDVKLSY